MCKDGQTLTLFEISEAEQYDLNHSDIWIEFERIALDLIGRGVKHYGAKAIFEVVRFHRTIEKLEGEDFKCNNNFTAYYARKFIEKYPEHEGFFELRSHSRRKRGTHVESYYRRRFHRGHGQKTECPLDREASGLAR